MDKHLGDGLSIMTAIATLVGWLPSISALVTIVWVCIRIYETQTVQAWMGASPKAKEVSEDEYF